MNKIVLISGHVSAGKTTLADHLVSRFNVVCVRTRDVLKRIDPAISQNREEMQNFGEWLDKKTKGEWVRDGLKEAINTNSHEPVFVVDAVRIPSQIAAIRRAYGSRMISHIHLTAQSAELKKRYVRRRQRVFREFASYSDLLKNKTEADVDELRHLADVVIETDRCTVDDVIIRAASHLGFFGKDHIRLVDVLVGGQYGSEGKGNIAAYLAKEYDVLIRVGGPNAGHKVYEEPKPYTFQQLPSGTRASEAELVIGPGAVINPEILLREIADCKVSNKRLSIDPQAIIIEQSDIEKETNGIKGLIASTGQGVGWATARRILDRGKTSVRMAKDYGDLKPFVRSALQVLDNAFAKGHKLLLEGTQGTGLSIYHGHYPHVTSRDTTVSGCLAESGIAPNRVRKVIMVCRRYPIRVGNPPNGTSGYMSKEITFKEISRRSGVKLDELEEVEKGSVSHRLRRVGEFDWALLRRSVSLNSPIDIALTFADYISIKNREARRFEQLTSDSLQFIEEVERITNAPVSLISTRFSFRNIIDRRTW